MVLAPHYSCITIFPKRFSVHSPVIQKICHILHYLYLSYFQHLPFRFSSFLFFPFHSFGSYLLLVINRAPTKDFKASFAGKRTIRTAVSSALCIATLWFVTRDATKVQFARLTLWLIKSEAYIYTLVTTRKSPNRS